MTGSPLGWRTLSLSGIMSRTLPCPMSFPSRTVYSPTTVPASSPSAAVDTGAPRHKPLPMHRLEHQDPRPSTVAPAHGDWRPRAKPHQRVPGALHTPPPFAARAPRGRSRGLCFSSRPESRPGPSRKPQGIAKDSDGLTGHGGLWFGDQTREPQACVSLRSDVLTCEDLRRNMFQVGSRPIRSRDGCQSRREEHSFSQPSAKDKTPWMRVDEKLPQTVAVGAAGPHSSIR